MYIAVSWYLGGGIVPNFIFPVNTRFRPTTFQNILVSPRAGRLVTQRLMDDLGAKDFAAVQKAKEQFCQLLENPDVVNSRRKYSFKTVDGSSYTLTGEEYTSPEVLFRLSGSEEGMVNCSHHFLFVFTLLEKVCSSVEFTFVNIETNFPHTL